MKNELNNKENVIFCFLGWKTSNKCWLDRLTTFQVYLVKSKSKTQVLATLLLWLLGTDAHYQFGLKYQSSAICSSMFLTLWTGGRNFHFHHATQNEMRAPAVSGKKMASLHGLCILIRRVRKRLNLTCLKSKLLKIFHLESGTLLI